MNAYLSLRIRLALLALYHEKFVNADPAPSPRTFIRAMTGTGSFLFTIIKNDLTNKIGMLWCLSRKFSRKTILWQSE